VDQSGTREDVTFLVVFVAGLIDSALIFVLSLIVYATGSMAIRSAGYKNWVQ
jgi:hypothetical protein